ncbi:MAG: UDP-N-acetylmuramoyl-tripeptide--D-alanyl-D-alanine ligase [Parachlamydiales bacterium]|nr:UDP-N-acetylmuramoyl-tripeptide--D-alanyl-D-alanine ligase [Parachlamydiales bacterium]
MANLQDIAVFFCQNFPAPLMITSYCIDSRLIEKGGLFFALSGQKTDAHMYLEDVFNKGAVAAVVSNKYTGPSYGLVLIYVEDVLVALQSLAKHQLKNRRSRVIGITGSLGKTTTKEFTKTLLQKKYNVAANPRSYNSQATLPLVILNSDPEADILLLEMGMTNKGELANLVNIAPPEVALITLIGITHVGFFPDGLDGIANAKTEIFSHDCTKLGLYSLDSPCQEKMKTTGKCQKMTFSMVDPSADFHLRQEGKILHLYEKGVYFGKAHWPFQTDHLIPNFLNAFALARIFDVSKEDIEEASQELKLVDLRLQQMEKNGIVFINDAFNAITASIKGALVSLPQPKGAGRKIAVLGAMPDLGSYSDDEHREVGLFALDKVEKLLLLGKECLPIVDVWKEAGKEAIYYECKEKLVADLKALLIPGDVVLLKGARRLSIDQVFEML